MSDNGKTRRPPHLLRRAICTCETCGSTSRSLIEATECCLGSRKQRTILSVGEPCSATSDTGVAASRTQTVQHQLSLTGSGHFCRLGCCDFSEKYAKHECKREQVS